MLSSVPSSFQMHVNPPLMRQRASRHLTTTASAPALLQQPVYLSQPLRYVIALLTVVLPVLFTAWSFYLIGMGVAPPTQNNSDAGVIPPPGNATHGNGTVPLVGDSDSFHGAIYQYRGGFTGANTLTNVLFTLLFAHSIYSKLIKKDNYTKANFLLAGLASVPGTISAANFFPLLENARAVYALEYKVSETANKVMQIANFGGVGGGAYINTIACYGILQMCIGLLKNIRKDGLRPTLKQSFKDPLNRVAVPLALGLGIFYWAQVSRYVADFFKLPLAAALVLCTGDFFFGNFYLFFGLYQVLNGFAHLRHKDPITSNCAALTLNLNLLLFSLAWDALNIIPTYSQGTDLTGQIGLIIVAMILNFYPSNRLANVLADLVALSPRNAWHSLTAQPKDDDHPEGAEPSFNTTLPLASMRTGLWATRCCRQQPKQLAPAIDAISMTGNPMKKEGSALTLGAPGRAQERKETGVELR